MRGLLLTNYYLVYRTFFTFMGIAILGSGFVFILVMLQCTV